MCTKTNGVYSYKDSNLAHRSSPKTSQCSCKNQCCTAQLGFSQCICIDTLVRNLLVFCFSKHPQVVFVFGLPMIPSRYPIGTLRVSQGEKKERRSGGILLHGTFNSSLEPLLLSCYTRECPAIRVALCLGPQVPPSKVHY